MKLESSIQLSPEDILLKEIRDLKAAVTTLQTENAALKTDVATLKAKQISVITKTNDELAKGSVVVKCDEGTTLMTCVNNSSASGSDVSRTTAITNTQCTCTVTGGSGFAGSGNRIQAVG